MNKLNKKIMFEKNYDEKKFDLIMNKQTSKKQRERQERTTRRRKKKKKHIIEIILN